MKPINIVKMKESVFFLFTLLIFAISCSTVDSKEDHQESKSYEATKDSTQAAVALVDTTPFIQYFENTNEQKPFKTRELSSAKVTLFPNLGTRKCTNDTRFSSPLNQLIGVYGVNQFFMDFDLTTGFVHTYTKNMFNNLSPDGFVLQLTRDPVAINKATISYIRKKDLAPSDSLGINIGFCRQWRLSEIDIVENKVLLKRDPKLNRLFISPKQGTSNPYNDFVKIWSDQTIKEGYYDINSLNILSGTNGGTAVIIWETKQGEIRFIDIHGSIKDIITELQHIAAKYDVDPTLGVYDAAGMAQKMKADANHMVSFDEIDKWCGGQLWVGAGYGFDI